MSMPGFVFHIRCLQCQFSSPDYPLYVFPDLFRADILLPAWSKRFGCFSALQCYLRNEDQEAFSSSPQKLLEFAKALTSPGLTVGVPRWRIESDGIQVEVEPNPECPRCDSPASVLFGYPESKSVPRLREIASPYAVPLSVLGLSVRAFNCLQSTGIENLGQLCEYSPKRLLAIGIFGEGTLDEVRQMVESLGFHLSAD